MSDVQDSWTDHAPFLGGLQNAARSTPNITYIDAPDGCLTYCASAEYAGALAKLLYRDHQVERGDRVLIVDAPSKWFAISVSAVQSLGAIPVPVNPANGREHVETIAEDCEPRLAIIPGEAEFRLSVPALRLTDALAKALPKHEFKPVLRTMAAPALILYTTGSTGQAKGVVVPYTAHIAAVDSLTSYLAYPKHCRLVLATPNAFDYGLYQYALAIKCEGTVVVASRPFLALDLLELIGDKRIDTVPLVPTQWRSLMGCPPDSLMALSPVLVATSTGSPIDAGLMHRILDSLPNGRFFSMYGLTECKRVAYLDPAKAFTKPESVGQPMPNCEADILQEDGNPSPEGEIGELAIRGPSVANGYWNDPVGTHAVFRRDARTGEVTLWSGDLFWRDDEGDLHFVGRKDDLVKVSDIRISLIEVEKRLRAIPALGDAVAFVRLVDGVPELCAQVVAPEVRSLAEVKRQLRDSGCPPHMMPKRLYVVDALVWSANGKPTRPDVTTPGTLGTELGD